MPEIGYLGGIYKKLTVGVWKVFSLQFSNEKSENNNQNKW